MAEPKRVLAVNYERHVVRLIESNLRRQGYAVECALGTDQAKQLLGSGALDIAIVNPDMPGAGGHELREWILQDDRTKDVQVIMMDLTQSL